MIEEGTKEWIATLPESATGTIVIQLSKLPEEPLSRLHSSKERISFLADFVSEKVATLAGRHGISAKDMETLGALGQVIVRASPGKLLELVASGGELALSRDLNAVANKLIPGVQPASSPVSDSASPR